MKDNREDKRFEGSEKKRSRPSELGRLGVHAQHGAVVMAEQ